ncbi:S-adenosyl-L-methionine-dependent methyltransferase [Actinoplanes siamensis]|uniref:S-adenosyl-L-methionine-dependent methyltransferase n=2 Tax=Actinoplanes siamensis TaxID=1223317 RepID=A0A919N406_9ACTN|nr:S-adenosyl-L-methionine-dependent methyltransferase [Actinoplanes siamensis]
MASKRVENTALGVGTIRAMESHEPPEQRLFDDQVAEGFLTGVTASLVRHGSLRRVFRRLVEAAAPGIYGSVVCRTHLIDDACTRFPQVVIVGAGMDTRPYRLRAMSAPTPVWEIDLPAVQTAKMSAVHRTLGTLPANVRYVPADLAESSLSELLPDAGFDASTAALLICEAVLQYLPAQAADSLFAFAGGLPAGSRLIFTYLPEEVLRAPRHARRVRHFHWQTGFDPARLPDLLTAHGLTLTADLGRAEFESHCLAPRSRRLPVAELERIAIAEVGPPTS